MRTIWRFLAWLLNIYIKLSQAIASFLSSLSKYPGLGKLRPVVKAIRWPLTFLPGIQERLQLIQLRVKTTGSKAKSLVSAVRSVRKK
jgi:hypothetical protein